MSAPIPSVPSNSDKPVSNTFSQKVKTFCGRIWNHVTNLSGYLAHLAQRIGSAVDTFFQTAFQDLLEEQNADKHISSKQQDEVHLHKPERSPIQAKKLHSSKPPTRLLSLESVSLEKPSRKTGLEDPLTQIRDSYSILDKEWRRQNPGAPASEKPSIVDYQASLDPYGLYPSRKQVDVQILHATMLDRAQKLQIVDRINTPLIKKEAPGVIDVPGAGNCFFYAFIVALSLSKNPQLKASLKEKLGFEIGDINQLTDGKLKHKKYLFGKFPQQLRELAVQYLKENRKDQTVLAKIASFIITINLDIQEQIKKKETEIESFSSHHHSQFKDTDKRLTREEQLKLSGKQISLKLLKNKLILDNDDDQFWDIATDPGKYSGVAHIYALSTLFKVRICFHMQGVDGGLGNLTTTENADCHDWPIIYVLHTEDNHFKAFDPDLAREQTEIPLIPQ